MDRLAELEKLVENLSRFRKGRATLSAMELLLRRA